jgi:hypothetical protein
MLFEHIFLNLAHFLYNFNVSVGHISDSNLRVDILHSLRLQPKPGSSKSLPLKLSISLKGHTKAVNRVDWSSSHGQYILPNGILFHLYCKNK